MRKPERVMDDMAEIEDVLNRARTMRLGLLDAGRATVVPVSFGYAAGNLYFHSSPKGRKMDLVRANPDLAFEVTTDERYLSGATPCRYTVSYRCVLGRGLAVELADEAEKRAGLDLIMQKVASLPPAGLDYEPKVLAAVAVVRIGITSLSGKKAHLDRPGADQVPDIPTLSRT